VFSDRTLGSLTTFPSFEELFHNFLETAPVNEGAPPATPSEIESLDSVTPDDLEGERSCSICQDEITSPAIRLPCQHYYHKP
jgi:hypothetical protein